MTDTALRIDRIRLVLAALRAGNCQSLTELALRSPVRWVCAACEP